ncbi:MAG TPA: alanine racemase [Bacillota bacterium]
MSSSVRYPTVAEIHLPSFQKNIKALKKLTDPALLMAVVKTNAYGHGLVQMSEASVQAGADRLGVSTVEEGIRLREQGIRLPIHLLSAIVPQHVPTVVDYKLIPSVSSTKMAIALSEEARRQKKDLCLHLKIDTGLHRFGCSPAEALSICQACFHLPYVTWEGIYTHFSRADEGDWHMTEKQFTLFQQTVTMLEEHGFYFPIHHVGGSTVAIEREDMHLNMVRPGISLFGYYPHSRQQQTVTLQPVLTLKTKIVHCVHLPPRNPVGYGGHYVTKKDETIAILPIGHGDGYQRRLSNKGEVLVNGKRAPIVGMISLDQTMIDVTHIPNVSVGDDVVLIGTMDAEEIMTYDVARWMGSIVDEVTSSLTERILRQYLK